MRNAFLNGPMRMYERMKTPKLPVDMQVKRLKARGVKFAFMSERETVHYLETNHNIFKLQEFERLFPQRADGTFVDLDFGYLRDLYNIDMRLRNVLLIMCMEVEHHAKLLLMKAFSLSLEDGYAVITDFEAENGARVGAAYQAAQKDAARSPLLSGDSGLLPIWTFIEIIDFALFVRFFCFFARRLLDRELIDESYRLMSVAELRGSLSQNRPLLSRLSYKTQYRPNYAVLRTLGNLPLSKSARKHKMRCDTLRQIVTLLYVYASVVPVSDTRTDLEIALRAVSLRAGRHLHFYERTPKIHTSLSFLCGCIDNMFPKRYTY